MIFTEKEKEFIEKHSAKIDKIKTDFDIMSLIEESVADKAYYKGQLSNIYFAIHYVLYGGKNTKIIITGNRVINISIVCDDGTIHDNPYANPGQLSGLIKFLQYWDPDMKQIDVKEDLVRDYLIRTFTRGDDPRKDELIEAVKVAEFIDNRRKANP